MKLVALVAVPPGVVTAILPVVAPEGTGTTIVVVLGANHLIQVCPLGIFTHNQIDLPVAFPFLDLLFT